MTTAHASASPEAVAALDPHAIEVARGDRFEFGENWARFLAVLDDGRIAQAERSLREMLEVDSLQGLRFLDIGSGSGLFSLAARRLGADGAFVRLRPAVGRVHARAAPPLSSRRSRLDVERARRSTPTTSPGSAGSTSSTRGACCTTPGRCGRRSTMRSGRSHRTAGCSSRSTTTPAARARAGSAIKHTYTRLPCPLRAPFAIAVSAPKR